MFCFQSYFFLFVLFQFWAWTTRAQTDSPLGTKQSGVQWRAGHVAAYIDPYMVVYGGTEDPSADANSDSLVGSAGLWVWNSKESAWYHPQVRSDSGAQPPQVFFGASELPSPGQMLAVVSNTSGGNMLQKLDTNTWSWSFPTASLAPDPIIGFALACVNNTLFTYGGMTATATGHPSPGAVQNNLYRLDANAYQWSSGSNGLGITDHAMCYVPRCNCLLSFGGTTTGSRTSPVNTVLKYDLGTFSWDLQVVVQTDNNAAPGARRLHTATCLDDKMIIFGGGTTQPFDSDVWILDVSSYPTLRWRKASMSNLGDAPNPRMGHTAVLDSATQKIYIFGGWGIGSTNDTNVYVLDTANWVWSRIAPVPASSTTSSTGNDSTGPATSIPSANGDNKLGVIIGASIGGALALAIAAGVLACLLIRRRRHRRNSVSEKHLDGAVDRSRKTNSKVYYGNNAGEWHEELSRFDEPRFSMTTENLLYTPGRRSMASVGGLLDSAGNSTVRMMVPSLTLDELHTVTTRSHDTPRTSEIAVYENGLRGFQTPNEITTQKPNEISKRIQRHLPADVSHYHVSPESPTESSVPHSSSMDVLRSVKSEQSSMRNSSLVANAGGPASGVAINHHQAYRQQQPRMTSVDEEQENCTLPSSFIKDNSAPMRYLEGDSKQFSMSTASDPLSPYHKADKQSSVAFIHHQYPSSSMSTVPTASPIPSHHYWTAPHQARPVAYDAISPLEMLATLGRLHHPSSDEAENNNNLDTASSSTSASSASPLPGESVTATATATAAQSLADILPRRYHPEPNRRAFVGSSNTVIFVTLDDNRPIAIKAFGRREAWERECRTLIKLRSERVVSLLEVLTIQGEQRNKAREQQQRRYSLQDAADIMRKGFDSHHNEEEEDGIKYAAVMERLDETLASFIRKLRSVPDSKKRKQQIRIAARAITECLKWCHSKGVAFCDLKPSNIMRAFVQDNNDHEWKLIDFEASRTIDQECVGVITPRYCPPEVARATTYGLEGANGVVATASVDMWSLGCVIYELETTQPLFARSINDEIVLHFVSHPSPLTPILKNGIRWNDQKELEIPHLDQQVTDPEARQIIKMLLSRDPLKRGTASGILNHPYFATTS